MPFIGKVYIHSSGDNIEPSLLALAIAIALILCAGVMMWNGVYGSVSPYLLGGGIVTLIGGLLLIKVEKDAQVPTTSNAKQNLVMKRFNNGWQKFISCKQRNVLLAVFHL